MPRDPNEKRYETSDGESVTLNTMVRVEPEWAASRIRCGESAERALFKLRGQVADLRAAVTKRLEALAAEAEAAWGDIRVRESAQDCHADLSEVAESLRLLLEVPDDAA